MSRTDAEWDELSRIAEYHAYSVRQLIGQRARHLGLLDLLGRVAKFDSGDTIAPVISAIHRTESQFLPDIICLILSRGKREGYFVEFGACDGKLISNTYSLETQFGWRGILAEPMKKWHEALKANRNCSIDTRCVWSQSGKVLNFVEFADDLAGTESRVVVDPVSVGDDRKLSYDVETVSIVDLLRTHDAPPVIDFISIDVEGEELSLLRTLPFDRYDFRFVCVEQHGKMAKDVHDFMISKGYRQIGENMSGYDGFYINFDF